MSKSIAKRVNADVDYVEPFAKIPRQRNNPIDPLMMYSASLTMADAKFGYGRFSSRKKRAEADRNNRYAGARAMLYSPLGHGSSS